MNQFDSKLEVKVLNKDEYDETVKEEANFQVTEIDQVLALSSVRLNGKAAR